MMLHSPSFRTSHKDNAWGVVPTPDPVEAAGWIEKSDQFSQELQIASLPSSSITWVGGAYYLHARVGYQPFTITGPAVAGLDRPEISPATGFPTFRISPSLPELPTRCRSPTAE